MEWTELHIPRKVKKEEAARRTAFRRPDFTWPPHVFSGCGAFAARIAVLCLLLCSCSLDDYRDECCERGPAMRYSYCPYGQEAFAEYISTLRHYLFDEAGNYLGELSPGADLQYQPLSLEAGSYTMVTVGNASEQTLCECAPQQGLENFELAVRQRYEDREDLLCNGDQLYWGVKSFEMDGAGGARGLPVEGTRGATEEMITYMNNIHCHMEVKVVWDNMPERVGDYEMELENVHAGYSLCPERSQQAGGFIVPACGEETATHRLRVPLRSQELYGEFVTLRYTDERIPTFRLRFASEQITPDIDLGRAFRTWGWYPSDTHVQKYRIQVKIFGDGRVEVTPWIDASVEDWVNGGTFG